MVFYQKKVILLILEWDYEHRDELIQDWELAQNCK
jgi:hypothetical protein